MLDTKKEMGRDIPVFYFPSICFCKRYFGRNSPLTSRLILPFPRLTSNYLRSAAYFFLRLEIGNWYGREERFRRAIETSPFKFLRIPVLFPRNTQNLFPIALCRCSSVLPDDCVCLMNTATFTRQFNGTSEILCTNAFNNSSVF